MNDLRVLFISTTNSGVTYWRMFNFLEAAHRNRVFYGHLLWWKKDYSEEIEPNWEIDLQDPQYRTRILNELDSKVRMADIVVMQMVHFRISLEVFLGIKEMYPDKRIVAECDDNFMSTADYNPAWSAYAQGTDFRRLAVQQFQAADAMVVSTPYMAQVYSDLNDYIYVVPNCIDFKAWNHKPKNKPGIRIGWAGGSSHTDDLRIVDPVVTAVLGKHKEARFVFVHGVPEFLKRRDRVECVLKFERIDKYPKFIAGLDFDIGIAPLKDNAYNRAKSNIRWLENAALSIPVVASDVGHFKEIRHGIDGLLVYGQQDWIDSISALIQNHGLRVQIGASAYKRVKEDFNVDKIIFDYEKILREIIARGRVKKDIKKILGEVEFKDVQAGNLLPA